MITKIIFGYLFTIKIVDKLFERRICNKNEYYDLKLIWRSREDKRIRKNEKTTYV